MFFETKWGWFAQTFYLRGFQAIKKIKEK